MRPFEEEWTSDLAWAEVYAWLPEALEHAKDTIQRMIWELEEQPGGPTYRMLRQRVLEGSVEHDFEMFRTENASMTRFSNDVREEIADAIIYSAMLRRHTEFVKAQVRIRQGRVLSE